MIRNRKNLPAFSLPELLVVLVIMEADEKGFKVRATAVVDFGWGILPSLLRPMENMCTTPTLPRASTSSLVALMRRAL
ncbi:MAG TPA: hypothetical protein DCF48_03510 [Rikenellaceae bacterium]|nr:hypothetical protein [Rikenellaceae bacterium]